MGLGNESSADKVGVEAIRGADVLSWVHGGVSARDIRARYITSTAS